MDKLEKADKSENNTTSKSRIFGFLGLSRKEGSTEDEIKDMVADNADLADDEKRMISDLLDLSDMIVREIMKPRVDMIMVEDVESGRTALDRMRGTGYSRLPVFHEEVDNVIGIVYYKDLIGPLLDGSIDSSVVDFMYEPYYVPETKSVIPLLGELQEFRQQMAIVVDEYGGTDGLITMEDIVEEIVGEIADEADNVRDQVINVKPGQWRAEGRFPVEDAIELGWPLEESDDYETLAGWYIGTLGHVPRVGEEIVHEGHSFKVEKMRRSRIAIIRVTKLPQENCEDLDQQVPSSGEEKK
jgi:putative hemolysin